MNLRRRPRKDPVSAETRLDVYRRDGPCVVWWLDSDITCDGRSTLDHVKDEQRMGVRAPSDMAHLVAICAAHSEEGARGGYQWNTANRPLLRAYLRHVQQWPPMTAGRLALAEIRSAPVKARSAGSHVRLAR